MIRLDYLINSIAAVIAGSYDYTVYLDDIEEKEGFERPSFFIYRISDRDTPLNRYTYNKNSIIQIVYFSPIDKYENIINKADQTDVIENLKFRFMTDLAIKCDDKWAKIIQINTDYTSDKDIYLQLILNTTIGTRQESDLPTVQEISFKGGVE